MKPRPNHKNGKPSRCLRIYIPSRDSRARQIKNHRMVKDICAKLVRLFQGCTKYEAQGMWRNGDGKIIGEDIIIVETYGSGKNFQKAAEEILPMLQNFKSQHRQESMAVLIDKTFHLI